MTEIVFVLDGCEDNTESIVLSVGNEFPQVKLVIIRNLNRRGAPASRNIGVAHSSNEFILFCDDDEYLELRYASTCYEKMIQHEADIVSGRRVYMLQGESPQEAISRFGSGYLKTAAFDYDRCEYVNDAQFEGDISLPFTNANILTRSSLLRNYRFDEFYVRGGGYREETDFQMNAFVSGHRIIMTNCCHSVHLPLDLVKKGGQRTSRTGRVFWRIRYNLYFLRKYHKKYSLVTGRKYSLVGRVVRFGLSLIADEIRSFVTHRFSGSR